MVLAKVLQVTYGDPSGWDGNTDCKITSRKDTTMIDDAVQFRTKSDHGADALTPKATYA